MTTQNIPALTVADADPDPWVQMRQWFAEGKRVGAPAFPTVTLATAGADGKADARLVQVRGMDERGLWFCSSERSRTGLQLDDVPYATLIAYWPELARQLRVRGPVEPLSDVECDEAFGSRTRESQLGYWANVQSEPIEDRATLKRQVAEVAARFPDVIPRPGHWLVYLVRPELVELWQYGAENLHDRVEYLADGSGGWTRQRLQP